VPKEPLSTREDSAGPREPEPARIPAITFPKGGGALRSIDEKFSVNAANGTCDLSLPLPFSKTRSGLDSGLALRYSSGAGNGAFGLGWSLSLPTIQRRTDKQLPRYEDAFESDVFLFSGAEDLVPAYARDDDGHWARDVAADGPARAERYRPRIEGLFARIEKITIQGETGFWWKVTSRENVVTVFGRTAAARIADPADPNRIFRWLPEWIYDDKGNCVEFVYKDEDLAGTPDTVEEKNRRAGLALFANKYLKRVRYGNKNPYRADPAKPLRPAPPADSGYFYETVFDYGEHDAAAPAPTEARSWPCRFDPFSDCRAGFEMRTWRLCRRILFFHSFAELSLAPPPQPDPCLVRSLDFEYRHFRFDNAPSQSQEADFITSVRRVHFKRTAPGVYQSRSLPALELTYHELAWNQRIETVSPEDVVHAPTGASAGYQWLDLDGEGAPGILTEQAGAWYYKSNLGEGHFSRAATVIPKPSFTGVAAGTLQIQDLDANGSKQLVSLQPGLNGFFPLGDDGAWRPFRAFEQIPAVSFTDPGSRFLDLDGDGRADLLISEESVFRWYPSLGTRGYDAPRLAPKAVDEERGPTLVFTDATQKIFIADMNGDGLGDVVRVRNGEVCYWPSLGHGRFGAKVTMRSAPTFDHPQSFDPGLVELADVSGTGAMDLLYLGHGGFTAWINLAGNAWSEAQPIDPFPGTEPPNRVSVIDLLGNGTASLVWSSELPANAPAPLRYVDLMGGRKPYVLSGLRNNLGKETRIEYKSSSHYALLDRREGRPWVTKLPFPAMCVSRVETRDAVSGCRFVQEYRYRHGYYDHAEREFRGFGMVEELDTETFERFAASGASNVVDRTVHQPPVRTRTWYHTGAFVDGAGILHQFQNEYYRNAAVPEPRLPDAVIATDPPADPLTPEEMRQAARACKGMVLRQEIYADDGAAEADQPYTTAEHNCHVRRLQPRLGNPYAVFLVHESEAVTRHYERNPADPRVAHTLNTVIDERGNVLEAASIVYGRRTADATLPAEVQAEQRRLRITYTVRDTTNDVATLSAYRLRQLCETQVFEVTGAPPPPSLLTPSGIRNVFLGAAPLAYEETPHPGAVEKRRTRHERTLFATDADVNQPLRFKELQSLGLHYEDYRLAFTPSLLTSLYAGKVTDALLAEGKYLKSDDLKAGGRFLAADPDGHWWTGSGIVQYPASPDQHFYLPDRYVDPFGSTTRVRYYADYHLVIDQTQDALGNKITAQGFDFRFLQPRSILDLNDNLTEAAFDILGLVVGTAVRGKGSEADDLTGFDPDPTPSQIAAFLLDPVANGAALLQHATSRFVYSFDALPAVAASIQRETHHRDAVAAGKPSELRFAFEYSDGLGQVAMSKIQAEPGTAKRAEVQPDGTVKITAVDTTPNRRWVGSGRIVRNNKGNPVMEYEPYFSVTHRYETAKELVASGVTPVLRYDPLSRPIRTDFPDGSFSRVLFDAWTQSTYDRNDNVQASDWYRARKDSTDPAEKSAAEKTTLHDDTPTVAHFDSLGRAFYKIEKNRFVDRTGTERRETYATLDVLDVDGNRLAVRDPRNNAVMRYAYDLLARPAHTTSMDAGERWTLNDGMGKALYGWDAKGNRFHTRYDALHRPTEHEALPSAGTAIVFAKSEYGTDKTKNQNGQLVTRYDGSGIVVNTKFDFKGNLLASSRTFAIAHTGPIDWSSPPAVALQPRTFTATNAYDALGRVIQATTPDGSVTTPEYSEASLLKAVSVSIRGGSAQPFIQKVEHDAKGQRTRVEHGNGVVTVMTYDDLTFRVRRIASTRTSDGEILQDLNYTYDPVGNITLIRDLAHQPLYFNNAIVLPDNDFTYDAVYRLIVATGREHSGLNVPVSQLDERRTNLPHKANGNAMQRYRQEYEYDATGNMTVMAHSAGTGSLLNQWTRQFTPNATDNRLKSSQVGSAVESYTYDEHGNLTGWTGFGPLGWDFEDHLRSVSLGGGGTASYTYGADGNRDRKVIDRGTGLIEERLYVGSFEVFTRTRGGTVELQRETLHVMDGEHRLAMVDSRTAGTDGTPAQLIRYQFSNHLGTAALELDDTAEIISYEEYYPYGNTSLQTVDALRTIPAKRYRYTGKERDEETGFSYHGARYYAPWLARWISPDPGGLKDGTNVFSYVHQNPIVLIDPHGTESETIPDTERKKMRTQFDSLSFEGQLAAASNLSAEQRKALGFKEASPTVRETFDKVEERRQNWWLMEDLASSTVISAPLMAAGVAVNMVSGPVATIAGVARKTFGVLGILGTTATGAQVATGKDLQGNPLSEKQYARTVFHFISGLLALGSGMAISAAGSGGKQGLNAIPPQDTGVPQSTGLGGSSSGSGENPFRFLVPKLDSIAQHSPLTSQRIGRLGKDVTMGKITASLLSPEYALSAKNYKPMQSAFQKGDYSGIPASWRNLLDKAALAIEAKPFAPGTQEFSVKVPAPNAGWSQGQMVHRMDIRFARGGFHFFPTP
jgi:RHS repeat-associated protein